MRPFKIWRVLDRVVVNQLRQDELQLRDLRGKGSLFEITVGGFITRNHRLCYLEGGTF